MKTLDAARGKWHGILRQFGIEERFLRNNHGPCPCCDGKDRFRFDDKGGNGTYYCSQCGSGNGFDLLMEYTGSDFQTLAKQVDSLVGNIEVRSAPVRQLRDPAIRLREIAKVAMEVLSGNPVSLYLSGRGLACSPYIKGHAGLAYWEQSDNGPKKIGTYPAMLNRVVDPAGKPLTYHITYLSPNGEKAPVKNSKKLLPQIHEAGAPVRLDGAAIRLSPIEEHIGVAEGVESALAAWQVFGIPTWACINSTLLEKFEPPEGVKAVTIYADNDLNFAGQKAAFALANKLSRTHIVRVKVPATDGQDFADYLTDMAAKQA